MLLIPQNASNSVFIVSTLFYAVLIIIACILIIILILHLHAKNYLKEKKREIFENLSPLSQQCKKEGDELSNGLLEYRSNVRMLGLNTVYRCSRSIVSNAANNEIKYFNM